MPPPSKAAGSAAPPLEHGSPMLLCGLAWLVPGAGHFMLGQHRKAVIFFVVLSFMYAIGLGFGGRVFPLAAGDPLVLLAGLAQWANGLARVASAIGGFGKGAVTSVTYEYGNTFLIVSGLLNTLVVLNTFDVAKGRVPR